jgi:chromosome segregation ATPase
MADDRLLDNVQTQMGVILEKLNFVFDKIEKITNKIEGICSQQNAFIRDYIAQRAAVEQKAEAAHNRLDYVEKRIELLEVNIEKITDMMPSLMAMNKILIFIASAFGLSIVGLIWSLIIGQVQLIFP